MNLADYEERKSNHAREDYTVRRVRNQECFLRAILWVIRNSRSGANQ